MSEIQHNERVLFFPTYGWQAPDNENRHNTDWLLDVHGIIYRPQLNSRKREWATRAARSLLPRNDNTIEQTMFRRRFWTFLADNIGKRTIQIRIGGEVFTVGTSAADGHFRGTIRVSAELVASQLPAQANLAAGTVSAAHPSLPFEAIVPSDCLRHYRGAVQLIEPEGLSIISDIDDTIKISDVASTSQLIVNVLARRYQPVPGMAKLYRRWQRRQAAFHLVSASPWQLYRPLARFCRREQFPPASFHLKKWRLKEPGTLDLFHASADLKIDAIDRIVGDFPSRKFILIGDSTQKDPEIYGELLRRHQQQTLAALIRNVPNAEMEPVRQIEAFADVDDRRWQLFEDVQSINALAWTEN